MKKFVYPWRRLTTTSRDQLTAWILGSFRLIKVQDWRTTKWITLHHTRPARQLLSRCNHSIYRWLLPTKPWTLWGWFLYLHALRRQSHLPEEASIQSQLYPLGRGCCNPHYHRLCNRGNQQYKLFKFTYFLWQLIGDRDPEIGMAANTT